MGDPVADRQEVTLGGELLPSGGGSHLRRWVEYLDGQSAEWCAGPRRARFYFDEAVAEAHGFGGDLSESSALVRQRPHTAIIEQGSVQLWIALPVSSDPGVRFTSEVYDVLGLAGFYADDLAVRDSRSAFWQWLSRLGEATPEYVDLGGDPLRSAPGGGLI